MREAQFLQQNATKWKQFEEELTNNAQPDTVAAQFIELTDDLAYSKTFYPASATTRYLNGLASLYHQKIYQNKKEKTGRILSFWQYELPYLFRFYHRQFFYAFVFFLVFCLVGVISAKYDETFIRLILGDGYVDMTIGNIKKGDPFGVYKNTGQTTMFLAIASNNIKVALMTYAMGIFLSVGAVWMLFNNGLMLGSFEYFFASQGLGFKSITVIFIHGTLEIWALVVAGASGLIIGNSILFPGTYSRNVSIIKGGRDGLKIVIGLVPVFIVAAFLESFVTRYDNMPLPLSLSILGASLAFLIWYFIYYPIVLHKRINQTLLNPTINPQENFTQWLNKKLN